MPVLYRPSALGDIDAIHDYIYIAADNPDAARRVVAHMRNSIQRLTIFPKSGRAGIVPGTYELVVPRSRYIAVFEFIADHIKTVAVFDGAQDRAKLVRGPLVRSLIPHSGLAEQLVELQVPAASR